MGTMATMQLIGYLGADPRIGETDEGTPFGNFRVAETYRSRRNGADEPREITTWYTVSAFGENLVKACKYLKKGSQVFVEGRPKAEAFAQRVGIALNARRIVLLGKAEKGKADGAADETDAAGEVLEGDFADAELEEQLA